MKFDFFLFLLLEHRRLLEFVITSEQTDTKGGQQQHASPHSHVFDQYFEGSLHAILPIGNCGNFITLHELKANDALVTVSQAELELTITSSLLFFTWLPHIHKFINLQHVLPLKHLVLISYNTIRKNLFSNCV